MQSYTKTSKFMSKILRHQPDIIGITVDQHGWADTKELIRGINARSGHKMNMEILEEIVRTDEKQRYSFNADRTKIRANQGHSIRVDVELEPVTPPEILYHGTGMKYVAAIEKEGLKPKERLYVHLSGDVGTAIKVGQRHGKPYVYRIDTAQMAKDGYAFFESVNHVWLTKRVPRHYMHSIDEIL